MTLHLLVTELCDRNCEYCCNKEYDIANLPHVTEEELKSVNELCITGGEPFTYSNPCNIAKKYREKYPNIERVIVYTNALELRSYLLSGGKIHDIDGLSVSIKHMGDRDAFLWLITNFGGRLSNLPYNRVYIMIPIPEIISVIRRQSNFKDIERKWQEHFVPADDCIFRRG